MSQEVIVAVEAALQAGKILRERANDIGKISFKDFHDPVTEVDHLAEKVVITRIKKTFPDHQDRSRVFVEWLYGRRKVINRSGF